MTRGDLALALVLAVLTMTSRLPFRTHVLTTWDAIQFALARDEYDVVTSGQFGHGPGGIDGGGITTISLRTRLTPARPSTTSTAARR
jgi:hypothetical protein